MKDIQKMVAGEKTFIWILLIFSLFALYMAYQISGFSSISSPGSFPMFSTAVMLVSIIILIYNNRKLEKPEVEGLKDELLQASKIILPPVFLVYISLVILYMFLIQPFTFLPSSFGFLLISMIYLKGSTPLKACLISGGSIGIIYLVFHYLFRVVLP